MVQLYNGKKMYEGCVFNTFEENSYHDSDFYAECVNIETGEIDVIEYDTTRFAGYGNAVIDLTELNLRLYLKKSFLKEVQKELETNKQLSTTVAINKTVKVVKGRKVPLGTVGTVFWRKSCNYDKYNRWWHNVMRLGIKDSAGNVYWINESNVEVMNPEQYLASPQVIIRKCKKARSNLYNNLKNKFEW